MKIVGSSWTCNKCGGTSFVAPNILKITEFERGEKDASTRLRNLEIRSIPHSGCADRELGVLLPSTDEIEDFELVDRLADEARLLG